MNIVKLAAVQQDDKSHIGYGTTDLLLLLAQNCPTFVILLGGIIRRLTVHRQLTEEKRQLIVPKSLAPFSDHRAQKLRIVAASNTIGFALIEQNASQRKRKKLFHHCSIQPAGAKRGRMPQWLRPWAIPTGTMNFFLRSVGMFSTIRLHIGEPRVIAFPIARQLCMIICFAFVSDCCVKVVQNSCADLHPLQSFHTHPAGD